MSVAIEGNHEVMTAYLTGEIDHPCAVQILEEIDAAAERTHPALLMLDFTNVTFMDSSGIGLVMGRFKLMQALGGQLQVGGMSPQIRKMMKLAGLERLVTLEDGGKEQ